MGKSWKNAGKTAMAQKKGQVFTKLAREIQVSAKLGGPDPDANARLKMAITAARAASCPKDTIERALKKGSGQLDGGDIEELTYEGYGPHQVGIIVECQTDNKNRTVSEVRSIFNKNGGNMGESGSVMWMFDRVGMVQGTKTDVDDPEEEAIEAGANEVEKDNENENSFIFYSAPEDLDSVRSTLTERGWEISAAELSYLPNNYTDLSEEQMSEVSKLLEALEDCDDSHRVHASLK